MFFNPFANSGTHSVNIKNDFDFKGTTSAEMKSDLSPGK